jgi:hypothetical protein
MVYLPSAELDVPHHNVAVSETAVTMRNRCGFAPRLSGNPVTTLLSASVPLMVHATDAIRIDGGKASSNSTKKCPLVIIF